jgi:hypothetical protein
MAAGKTSASHWTADLTADLTADQATGIDNIPDAMALTVGRALTDVAADDQTKYFSVLDRSSS